MPSYCRMESRIRNNKVSNRALYTLYGGLFGLCFPFVATVIRSIELNLNPWEAQKSDILLLIIDTAPLFLGAFARIAGKRQDNIQRINRGLDEEVKRRTADLALAKEAAEKASRAKTSFLANVSHEIRTPLNSIIGFSQALLRNPGLDPKERDLVSAIGRSGNHLLLLINNILDISKIESDRMELNESEFNICDLLTDLSEVFRLGAAEKEFAWEYSGIGCGEQKTRVVGDAGKLRQVLTNLLGNAMKFARSKVVFSVSQDKFDQFAFVVADDGPGISNEEQKSIFEPFHQASAGIKAGGTGLGLSISRKLVSLMGGDLKVKSDPDGGTKFYFTVSLRIVERPDALEWTGSLGSTGKVKPIPVAPTRKTLSQGTTKIPFSVVAVVDQLDDAASLHKVTEIRQLLAKLEKLSPEAKDLAQTIEAHLAKYDMSAIREILAQYRSAA